MATINSLLTIRDNLEQNGFAKISRLLNTDTCIQLKNHIKQRLQILIKAHNCSEQIYFSAVNRWPLTAFVNEAQQNELLTTIAKQVKKITGLTLYAFEVDVLYKSIWANLGTPCHQDIAYVAHKPYLFSTWLALTDVSLLESPLQFLPSSHQLPISPAVDFWQPNYVDNFRISSAWQTQAITIPAAIADAFIFSANIWHGSLAYQANTERFALVIRWGNESLPIPNIPSPEVNKFGMWNCGKYTQALLQRGLKIIFNIDHADYLEIIKAWQQQLTFQSLPFDCDKEKICFALEKLRILNEAYQTYRAGDGQGIVYAEVWGVLLNRLEIYLK